MPKIVRILIAIAACLIMMFLTVGLLVFLKLESKFIILFVSLTTFSLTYKFLPKSKKEKELINTLPTEILHENGVLKEKGKTFNGKRIGAWDVFDEQGAFIRTDYYEDGVLVSTRRAE